MKNLQNTIKRHMDEAQRLWANDKDMQEMAIQDAVDTFAIMQDIAVGHLLSARARLAEMDTAPMEDVLIALEKDMGRKWTEMNMNVEFA